MTNRWMIFCAAFVVTVMIVACIVATLKIDLTQREESKKGPVRVRNFGEDIVLTQHGLYGVNLVKVGKAHMRKLRKGPFTIGAINELVLENVELALPEELWRSNSQTNQTPQGAHSPEAARTSPARILSNLGLNSNHLKMGTKMPRFSALSIRRLQVSRLEGTNVVPWFAASHAEAKRGGLSLKDGWSVEGGGRIAWKSAELVLEPRLRIIPLE